MLPLDKQVVHRKKRHPKKIPKYGSGPIFLGLMIIAIILALILISKLFSLIDRCGEPLSPDDKVAKKFSWNLQHNLYLAVKAEKNYLLSFNPLENGLVIYQIPDDLQVPVPFSFGHWLMGSVYQLGQGEKEPVGATLLKKTLTLNFGLPVEHYWIINNDRIAFLKLINQFKGNPLSAWQVVVESKTDLSAVELVKFWWGLKSVRQDKIKMVDLTQTAVTSWQLLPDGSRVLGISQIQLDQLIRTQLVDEEIKQEGKTLGFYNTTENLGLADRAARLAANLGGRVIFITNSSQPFKKTMISGPQSYTISVLAQIFSEEKLLCQKNFCQSKNYPADLKTDLNRAEINIFLGEDYYNRFNKLPE